MTYFFLVWILKEYRMGNVAYDNFKQILIFIIIIEISIDSFSAFNYVYEKESNLITL